MRNWRSTVSWDAPYWADYSSLLLTIKSNDFPAADDLNELLPNSAVNGQGMPIHFVASQFIPSTAYEEHIYATGEVSTRASSWHDFFNALVWACFPMLKSAMNTLHHSCTDKPNGTGRGKQRDALTLFDECGVIVLSDDRRALEAMANRDWSRVFSGGPEHWNARYQVFVIGHAMLEKFLTPYKAMTANALLVQVSKQIFLQSRQQSRAYLDAELANKMLSGRSFRSPVDLSPLPLAGIPGWWQQGDQDEAFYADERVFRPPVDNFTPVRIFALD